MITGLPKEIELSNGVSYPIRWDFRDVLNLFEALNDPDTTDWERGYYLLQILYEDWETIPEELLNEAVEKGLWFLNGGDSSPQQKGPKLMDWEQDYPILIPAINRVAGKEVRELPALHWWTFIGYYQEIGGDCTFAQVVSIRSKLKRGKKLSKEDREYYNRNKSVIDFRNRRTAEEDDFLAGIVKARRDKST